MPEFQLKCHLRKPHSFHTPGPRLGYTLCIPLSSGTITVLLDTNYFREWLWLISVTPQEPVWHLEESIHPEIIKWMNEWMNSVLVAQSCLTLCDPVHYSSPDSFVHGILQARILEWVAIPFSRGSFWPRDRTPISCIAGRFFTIWATGEAWVDE